MPSMSCGDGTGSPLVGPNRRKRFQGYLVDGHREDGIPLGCWPDHHDAIPASPGNMGRCLLLLWSASRMQGSVSTHVTMWLRSPSNWMARTMPMWPVRVRASLLAFRSQQRTRPSSAAE